MIIIKSNRIIEPLGIQLSRESEYALMAPAEYSSDEVEGYDGEIDSGTILKNSEYRLNGVIEHPTDKQQILDNVVAKFIECMNLTELTYEARPNMITYAKITGKPDFVSYATFTKISFDIRLDPFWYGVTEKALTGNCTLINNGTFETGLIIEITGPDTNPSLTIGVETISYTGTIPSGQKLIIDTELETAKIGFNNAMDKYNGVFPLLYPGEINVIASSNVTIKWRDKWI